MDLPDLCIHRICQSQNIPFALLLLADDELVAIEKYIHRSEIFVARATGSGVDLGVIALLRLNEQQLEVKALAVETSFHNRGIGKLMIQHSKTFARSNGFTELHVGTADCAYKEIAFYERCGFQKFGIKENFFIENYSKPLFENGIRLRDMVMLSMRLEQRSKSYCRRGRPDNKATLKQRQKKRP